MYGAKHAVGQAREYSPSRLFGAPAQFAVANRSKHLRKLQPQVRALKLHLFAYGLRLDHGAYAGAHD